MSVEFQNVIDRLEAMGKDPHKNGVGYKACCPAHDDNDPSLSVKKGDNGGVVLFCHANCTTEAVVGAMGMTMADLFPPDPTRKPAASAKTATGKKEAVYATMEIGVDWMARKLKGTVSRRDRYTDALGSLAFFVVRFDYKDEKGEDDKTFKPFRRDPDGWRMKDPAGKLPLYGLPDLSAATQVFVIRGGEVRRPGPWSRS